MKKNFGHKNNKVVAISVALFAVVGTYFCLSPTYDRRDIEKTMYEKMKVKLNAKFDSIQCYAEVVGKEMTPQLACNYISSGKTNLAVKYIGFPELVFGYLPLDGITYERNSPRMVQLSMHAPGYVEKRMSRIDFYWFMSLAEKICEEAAR